MSRPPPPDSRTPSQNPREFLAYGHDTSRGDDPNTLVVVSGDSMSNAIVPNLSPVRVPSVRHGLWAALVLATFAVTGVAAASAAGTAWILRNKPSRAAVPTHTPASASTAGTQHHAGLSEGIRAPSLTNRAPIRPPMEVEARRHRTTSRSARSVAVPRPAQRPPTERQDCIAACNASVPCILACPYAGDTRDGPVVRPTPTREQVLMAMGAVRGAVMMCAIGVDHPPASATVRVEFASSGTATHATAEGPFAGTGPGACIERAVERAHVPPFSSTSFEVRYPFTL